MPFKDPDKRREYQRKRVADKRERDRVAAVGGIADPPPQPVGLTPVVTTAMPLSSPAEALAILAEQVNAVRADTRAPAQIRGRTVAYLVAVALNAMQARDLLARVETIEMVLKIRGEGKK